MNRNHQLLALLFPASNPTRLVLPDIPHPQPSGDALSDAPEGSRGWLILLPDSLQQYSERTKKAWLKLEPATGKNF